MAKESDEKFSKDEATKRFEAALRGARLAQPAPLKNIPKKSGEARAPRKKKPQG